MAQDSIKFGPLTLKKCRYGWMLFNEGYVGTCFELYGEYSESELACLRNFIVPGDIVLDIGAYVGDLTIPLAQMVGPEGRVYAMEGSPSHSYMLCANLALNQITNAIPINARVGTQGQPAVIYENKEVPTMAVDQLNLPACRLIKIDVDGGELAVIKGSANTIARHRPFLYFENDIKSASQALLGHVLGLNYRLYWHFAPLFRPENFAGNPVNHWAPDNLVSFMILGIPRECEIAVNGLDEIKSPDEWADQKIRAA